MNASSFLQHKRRHQGIDIIDASSEQAFPRHTHETFGIGLLLEGAQKSWSGRGPVEAERGDIITVNPGEVHDGMPISGVRTWSMLYIAPDRVTDMSRDITDGKETARELHAPVLRDPRIATLFRHARVLAQSSQEEAFESALLSLLGALLTPETRVPLLSSSLERVRQRLDDDPVNAPDLAELATLSGLSRYATLRGFRRLTGMTPHDYLTQRRLNIARAAIRNGTRLVEAALSAGFADQSHFHRVFVARYGITPGALSRA